MRNLVKNLALAVSVALIVSACSGQPTETGGGGGDRGRPQSGQGDGRERERDPVAAVLDTEEADGGVGEEVEVGPVSVRIFDVRSEDVVHFAPGPGQGVGVKDSGSGEYVAVDFVARNRSERGVEIRPGAILKDDSGSTHRPDNSVRVPNLPDGAMELGPGQKRASSLFFDVPNGTSPESLGLLVSGEGARIDLLSDELDRVPPDDYLRVYHQYFAQKAYEETYEMYDPATTQDVTQGDWLTFYEPVWGSRFIGLDSLSRVFVGDAEASFEMDRTFYDREGEPVPDPGLNAPVLQDMVRSDGAWKFVMGQDLISEIDAEVPEFDLPSEAEEPEDPETTAQEETNPAETNGPETEPSETTEPTAPEATASAPGENGCADFATREEAQAYLTPGDPYGLDPDGDGLACEELP